MTCKEAVDSKIIPNKFVAYYLGILTEFYEKAGVDIQKSRFRKLGEKEKRSTRKLLLILRLRQLQDGLSLWHATIERIMI